MEIELERLVQERRQALLLSAVGLFFWLGTKTMQDAVPQWSKVPAITLLYLIGYGIWAYSLFLLAKITKVLKNHPKIARAFNDERVELTRLKAWRAGFLVAVGLQGLWIGILAIAPHLIAPVVVAESTLMLGCIVTFVAFLQEDKE